MKRITALLLCLALAVLILQPIPSQVNSPAVNKTILAEDPAPPFPPRPPGLLAEDPAPPFPPRPPGTVTV